MFVKKTIENLEYKSIIEQDKTIEVAISDDTIDRMNEKIDISAWDFTEFMQHPILIVNHEYDSIKKQIGEIKEIWIDGNKLYAKIYYYAGEGNEDANWAWFLSKQKKSAFSVGFLYENGFVENMQLENNKIVRVYHKVKLLEISQVVIPANANAVMKAVQPSKDLPLADVETAWDSTRAIANIREYCAKEDGTIDFDKYKKYFMWYDESKMDNLTSYKLGFADVIDGEPKAVFRALSAILAVLNGARGGVDIPEADLTKVYNVLKGYYDKFGQEVPELKTIEKEDNNMLDKKQVTDEISNMIIKAGAMISRANLDKLKQIYDALGTAMKVIEEIINANTREDIANPEVEVESHKDLETQEIRDALTTLKSLLE